MTLVCPEPPCVLPFALLCPQRQDVALEVTGVWAVPEGSLREGQVFQPLQLPRCAGRDLL